MVSLKAPRWERAAVEHEEEVVMNRSLVVLVALFLGGIGFLPAQASDFDARTVPYEHVGDFTSHAGETLNDFLLRVGPSLRAFSDRTGFEACGVIAEGAAGSFSIVVGSSGSHMACVNDPARVLAGYTSTGETMHSHGQSRQ